MIIVLFIHEPKVIHIEPNLPLSHMTKPPIPLQADAETIDEVLENLDFIIEQSVRNKNYISAFAYVYRRTTFEIKEAMESGRFQDAKRMEKFDVTFANLYIRAYYNFINGKPTSKSWAYAFDSKNEKLTIIQHILLGMNTHINMDLSIAAATVSKGKEIIELKNDFMLVNQILGELTNTIQQGLGKASVMMKLLDIFGFRSDEKIINFSIVKARDFAWINALELALLDKDNRNGRIEEIDKRVLEIGKMIKNPPGRFLNSILKFISKFETQNVKKIIEKMSGDKFRA